MEQKVNHAIALYVESAILPLYQSFDAAHGEEHVRAVIRDSLELAVYCRVNVDMAYVIAAYHDVGMPKGRDIHHLTSARILNDDQRLREWFSEEEIKVMKEAVEDHRASSENPPRSVYGRIVADADRDLADFMPLKRTILFGLAHYPELTKEEHYVRFCLHLREKYADGGYLRLWIPGSEKERQLQQLRDVISNADLCKEIFNVIYDRETSP